MKEKQIVRGKSQIITGIMFGERNASDQRLPAVEGPSDEKRKTSIVTRALNKLFGYQPRGEIAESSSGRGVETFQGADLTDITLADQTHTQIEDFVTERQRQVRPGRYMAPTARRSYSSEQSREKQYLSEERIRELVPNCIGLRKPHDLNDKNQIESTLLGSNAVELLRNDVETRKKKCKEMGLGYGKKYVTKTKPGSSFFEPDYDTLQAQRDLQWIVDNPDTVMAVSGFTRQDSLYRKRLEVLVACAEHKMVPDFYRDSRIKGAAGPC